MKFKILLFIYAITISSIYTQNTSDNILKESYASIYKKINASDKGSIQQRFLLEAYMQKARTENNWKRIVQGYKNYLHKSPREEMIVYADSMVYTALNSKDDHLVASAYLTKGLTYYWYKDYRKALDNYILSNKYLHQSNSENPYLKHKLSYNIGLIKYYLEQYEEALSELKSGLEYFETHNRKAYLATLHFTGHCYRNLGDFKMCSKINRQGIEKGKELGDRSMEVYFRESEGINQYYKRNYQAAIDYLEKVIPTIEKLGDFANVTLAHYYIGKSYWDLDKQQTAIPYLKLVDQSITMNKYIKQEILDTYTMLTDYFKSNGDSTTYLHYIEKQVQVTNTLMQRKNNLFPKINKEYDQANIIHKNNKTEAEGNVLKLPEHKNGLPWAWIVGSSLLFALFLWYLNINKPLITTNLDEFKQINEQNDYISKFREASSKTNIGEEKKIFILEQLVMFEKEKKYLDKTLSLGTMAVAFDTNSKYLSQTIKQEKGKSFSQYVNGLRIDWLIKSLRVSIMKGEYVETPLSKLAENAGFNSTRSLTTNFKLKTGMALTSYIQKLKAENSNDI